MPRIEDSDNYCRLFGVGSCWVNQDFSRARQNGNAGLRGEKAAGKD